MRNYIFVVLLLFTFECYSQTTDKILISGTVLSSDSVPISGAAVINIWSGDIVRTNSNGFFQIEIYPGDSLLVYHIFYKKLFISKNNQGGYILLKPEIHELNQVDVTDKTEQERKNLEETVNEIKRLAPLRKDAEYDMKSRQNSFIKQNGSHDKGFSPFFRPTTSTSTSLQEAWSGSRNQGETITEKLTAHYHLVKRKKIN